MSGVTFMIGGFVSKYLFLIGVALVPAPALAQDAVIEDDAQVLPIAQEADVITVTANGLGSPVAQTGQAVTVIAQDEIDSIQASDPLRVLQRIPGAVFSRNGGFGSVTGVRLRGAEAEQLLVLIDGVRVADPAAPGGGYDFGNLVTGTLGKVDVLRGANSTIWGSEAIGGVMDLSTRAGSGFEGSAEYGSRGTFAARASAGVADDRMFAGLYGSWFETDGYSAAASGTEDDGFRQFATGGSLFYDLTPSLEVFAHANYRESYLDIDGFPAPDYALADTLETQDTTQAFGDAGFTYSSNALTLRGAYSIASTQRANFNDDGTASFDSDGRDQRVSLRGDYLLIGGLRLAFGAEHGWSSFKVSYEGPERYSSDSTAGYAQLGWESAGLSVHAGARVEDYQGFGTRTNFGGDVSYALGRNVRLRASIGEGFKAPSLYQLFSFYGTPDLEPEESFGGDVGIEFGNRGDGPHVAVTAFRRDTDNLIGFAFDDPDRPFGAYANTARARAQGVEVEAGYAVSDFLRIGGVYGFLDAEDRDSGNDLARRPRHSATIFADVDLPFGLGLGADFRVAGASWDDSYNTTRLEGYEVLDLRASFGVGEHLELFGRVENVFDTAYQTAAGYASTPRSYFAGVRAKM